jgi:hypothetical protein
MMNLHPQFIGQNGTEEYVVLPIDEFRAVADALEDYEDLRDLRSAKSTEASATTASLADVIKQLDLHSG